LSGLPTGMLQRKSREVTMPEVIHLYGCTPTPLAAYLKALGILRLVAEQKDPEAKGCWQGEHFVLYSSLDEEELQRFFLEEYKPTPIIAPWNGGSGFYEKDNKLAIEKIAGSEVQRFEDYRQAVDIGNTILAEMGLKESPKDKSIKTELIVRLRASLSDIALKWIDAAITISAEAVLFPPLLGTGGNDGRLDFTSNFMQRICEAMSAEFGGGTDLGIIWLTDALTANPIPHLATKAIGQFAPGQVGGPNASTGFEAPSLMNPWDFILMIEGALLFAAATTRRLENNEPGCLSFPFTVRPKGAGIGAINLNDEGSTRAEIWMPIWSQAADLDEIKGLLSEGRVTVGRRAAKDGLDFVRGINSLAVARGIRAFQRYAFLIRSGKAYLATPLNRFHVPDRPQVDLISELDSWLERFRFYARRDEAPKQAAILASRLENALFDMTKNQNAANVQSVLILLGEIQRYLGRILTIKEIPPPVPRLSERWCNAAWDNTHEMRIAVALSGLRGEIGNPLPMRIHIAPVDIKQN